LKGKRPSLSTNDDNIQDAGKKKNLIPNKQTNPQGKYPFNFQQGLAVWKLDRYINITDIMSQSDDRKESLQRQNRLEHHPGTGPRLNISRDCDETP